jgi:hypothetical protein
MGARTIGPRLPNLKLLEGLFLYNTTGRNDKRSKGSPLHLGGDDGGEGFDLPLSLVGEDSLYSLEGLLEDGGVVRSV